MRREELGWRSSTYVSTISKKWACVVSVGVQAIEHGSVMRLRHVVSPVQADIARRLDQFDVCLEGDGEAGPCRCVRSRRYPALSRAPCSFQRRRMAGPSMCRPHVARASISGSSRDGGRPKLCPRKLGWSEFIRRGQSIFRQSDGAGCILPSGYEPQTTSQQLTAARRTGTGGDIVFLMGPGLVDTESTQECVLLTTAGLVDTESTQQDNRDRLRDEAEACRPIRVEMPY
jgi:hypothetical protein